MDFVFFLSAYLLMLCIIFIYESIQAISDPDETFDKTHGLYHI